VRQMPTASVILWRSWRSNVLSPQFSIGSQTRPFNRRGARCGRSPAAQRPRPWGINDASQSSTSASIQRTEFAVSMTPRGNRPDFWSPLTESRKSHYDKLDHHRAKSGGRRYLLPGRCSRSVDGFRPLPAGHHKRTQSNAQARDRPIRDVFWLQRSLLEPRPKLSIRKLFRRAHFLVTTWAFLVTTLVTRPIIPTC
jgi:hypothetical protein